MGNATIHTTEPLRQMLERIEGGVAMRNRMRPWVVLSIPVTLAVISGPPVVAQTTIKTAQDLQNMLNNLGGGYVLANDIDASNANGGQGFVPVGNLSQPFTGSLDGAGHTISGLTINPAFVSLGLFGRLGAGSSVKN